MTTYVLVHGGWAAGWVWDPVAGALRAAGHRVHAPDLPAHGQDRTPVPEAAHDDYVDVVLRVLDRETEPVVLVGHSSGGLVVSGVAEARPERVAHLVYVAAFVPADGETLFDAARWDEPGLVLPHLLPNADGTAVTIDPEVLGDALFHDCPHAHDGFAARTTPEPVMPVATPAKLSADRYGRVAKTYLGCRDDRALDPGLQAHLAGRVPGMELRWLPCGHMPMYAAPRELTDELLRLG